MITSAQCRAARGLLRLSQEELADRSKVLRATFESHGVAFLDENGGGVKLKG